ncbi:YqhA family protein [Pontixanthobacter gangjinensis]|uniref:YqhA family protein n=1 Tax=Christiangramia aestuarii TaxID=1028746 RepID=A0A7K1LSD3_9FLAO|nr:YqhA family protein [Christiangramia aestuarii]MUP43724.1 YqhA family protein [Christiangramia aestuarii]
MLNYLLKLRFLVVIIVLFTFLNSLILIFLAAKRSVHAYGIVFFNFESDKPPGVEILESIDLFLIGLVFLIFSLGLTKLFLGRLVDDEDQNNLPKWLRIGNFFELKILLWQTILVSLVVLFVDQLFQHEGEMEWNLLIIPAAILVLSISMAVIQKYEKH